MDKNCSSLKESLVALFATALDVTAFESGCIVTLPLKTVDDRYVDVFVEPVADSDFVYVHDGGKNTAELFTQGIHPTEGQEALLKGIARRYGVTFQNGRFQIACPNDAAIHAAVLTIGQCVVLAMVDVVSHEPKIEDESLPARVARTLRLWQPPYVEIERRVVVKGRTKYEHVFDFVSRSTVPTAKTVALKLLPPSVGTQWQIARLGFMGFDIKGQPAARWPLLTVLSRAEEWSTKSLEIVKGMSTDVILIPTDREERIEQLLPPKMTELTDAA